MKTFARCFVAAVLWFAGCASLTNYHLDALNATGGKIRRTKVTFENGKKFEWGVMDPTVSKTMWPMPGPLGSRATVQWEDADKVPHSNEVTLPHGAPWNAITFVIETGDVVTVETKWK